MSGQALAGILLALAVIVLLAATAIVLGMPRDPYDY